jgi:hypothetical protein
MPPGGHEGEVAARGPAGCDDGQEWGLATRRLGKGEKRSARVGKTSGARVDGQRQSPKGDDRRHACSDGDTGHGQTSCPVGGAIPGPSSGAFPLPVQEPEIRRMCGAFRDRAWQPETPHMGPQTPAGGHADNAAVPRDDNLSFGASSSAARPWKHAIEAPHAHPGAARFRKIAGPDDPTGEPFRIGPDPR